MISNYYGSFYTIEQIAHMENGEDWLTCGECEKNLELVVCETTLDKFYYCPDCEVHGIEKEWLESQAVSDTYKVDDI